MARFESIHLFAGGGGDLIASEMIGGHGVLAANHWTCAIENSSANYPTVDHLIGDLAIADPRRLPAQVQQATVLCASPECDGWSLSRNHHEEVSRLGPFDPKQGIGRSRATVWCPMRFATALPNLTTIIMEQVVDMVREARAFASYVDEWDKLGWRVQAISANSAIWGAAPQSRDRLYLLATRQSIPAPELEFTPRCRCLQCDADVLGIQTWKPKTLKLATAAGPVGKYGPRSGQYYYTCPVCRAKGTKTVVVPYIIPAIAAIEWWVRGVRIGDRSEPLAPATMRRIEVGLRRWNTEQLTRLSRLNDPRRDEPVPIWMPYPTQTGRQDMALVSPPNHEHRGYAEAWTAIDEAPFTSGTLQKDSPVPAGHIPTAGEAFAIANFGTQRGGHVREVTEQPFGTITGGGQYGISQQAILRAPREAIIASYYGSSAITKDARREPFGTQTGADRHALVEPPRSALVRAGGTKQIDVIDAHGRPAPTRMPSENYATLTPTGELPYSIEDAEFRMITPGECARVMGIHQRLVPQDDGGYEVIPYRLTGTKRDRVRLAGNSLTPGVEAEILDRALTAQAV